MCNINFLVDIFKAKIDEISFNNIFNPIQLEYYYFNMYKIKRNKNNEIFYI